MSANRTVAWAEWTNLQRTRASIKTSSDGGRQRQPDSQSVCPVNVGNQRRAQFTANCLCSIDAPTGVDEIGQRAGDDTNKSVRRSLARKQTKQSSVAPVVSSRAGLTLRYFVTLRLARCTVVPRPVDAACAQGRSHEIRINTS